MRSGFLALVMIGCTLGLMWEIEDLTLWVKVIAQHPSTCSQ